MCPMRNLIVYFNDSLSFQGIYLRSLNRWQYQTDTSSYSPKFFLASQHVSSPFLLAIGLSPTLWRTAHFHATVPSTLATEAGMWFNQGNQIWIWSWDTQKQRAAEAESPDSSALRLLNVLTAEIPGAILVPTLPWDQFFVNFFKILWATLVTVTWYTQ